MFGKAPRASSPPHIRRGSKHLIIKEFGLQDHDYHVPTSFLIGCLDLLGSVRVKSLCRFLQIPREGSLKETHTDSLILLVPFRMLNEGV